jgi:NAD(P)-dependent dehydrogenase (short-subunit alcohol dehydrogenase family)
VVGGPFDLTGQVAVVTGGNSGIGKGIAEGLAHAGANVCIWARNAQRSSQAAEELSGHGTRIAGIICDVTDPDAVASAFAWTLREFGRIDSCFANAGGVELQSTFVDMTLEEFRRITAVNLDGAFLTLQGAARHMIERGEGGSLVAISSLAALQGMARGQHYSAAKAGLVALTRSCAVELARYGIRANAIVPGWIETPATERAFALESLRGGVLRRIPAKRWGQPRDLAGVAVYLASPASEYHTGDALIVDGGYAVF